MAVPPVELHQLVVRREFIADPLLLGLIKQMEQEHEDWVERRQFHQNGLDQASEQVRIRISLIKELQELL